MGAIKDCIKGNKLTVNWKKGYASNVVYSHEQYPFSKSKELIPIETTDILNPNVKCYFANVIVNNNKYFTTGGRVMSIVSKITLKS